VAKLSEVEVFAAHGLDGLPVTTEVVGRQKIARAVALAAKKRDTIFVVDDPQNVRDLKDHSAIGLGPCQCVGEPGHLRSAPLVSSTSLSRIPLFLSCAWVVLQSDEDPPQATPAANSRAPALLV
jgi:hypothetical protein